MIFFKFCTRVPNHLTQLPTTQFYIRHHTSGFMAYFRFRFVWFFENNSWLIFDNNSSKWSVESRKFKKPESGVKLQISGLLWSNFKVRQNWVNCKSKWCPWRQLHTKRSHEVIRGHLKSKIPKDWQLLGSKSSF